VTQSTTPIAVVKPTKTISVLGPDTIPEADSSNLPSVTQVSEPCSSTPVQAKKAKLAATKTVKPQAKTKKKKSETHSSKQKVKHTKDKPESNSSKVNYNGKLENEYRFKFDF